MEGEQVFKITNDLIAVEVEDPRIHCREQELLALLVSCLGDLLCFRSMSEDLGGVEASVNLSSKPHRLIIYDGHIENVNLMVVLVKSAHHKMEIRHGHSQVQQERPIVWRNGSVLLIGRMEVDLLRVSFIEKEIRVDGDLAEIFALLDPSLA